MPIPRHLPVLVVLVLAACGDDGGANHHPGNDGSIAPGIDEGCGSVRLTAYGASTGGWCEFDRTLSVLPASVRQGLTLAIAEPWNGSSYGGEPGESCGECWEISTISATQVVMVHDLCPIEGNPLCAGGHFHFDLASEAGDVLHGGGLDEAQARRVPCPVNGNVHVQINDRNEWGYLRLQLVNHRIPIRTAEYRSATGAEYRPVTRSGGAWHVLDDGETFAAAGPGGVFRLTSAQGEVVEAANVLGYDAAIGTVFDLGVQLTDQDPPAGGACEFVPPPVYVDGYGGIPDVRWAINPWGEARAAETTEGCHAGSCIRVSPLPQWSGLHLYYRQAFPTSTFTALSLWLRSPSGAGEVSLAPSHDGARCTETRVPVGPEWSEVTVLLADVCAAAPELNGVTMDNPGDTMVLMLDDVRFVR
jgi:hypothetical protein